MNQATYYLCQRCGNCCRWPGFVRLNSGDIERLARFLDLTEYEFTHRYTEFLPDRTGLTLKERDDGSCIFLEDASCSVNPAKPSQCSGFPNTWNFPGWRSQCEAIALPSLRKSRPECDAGHSDSH